MIADDDTVIVQPYHWDETVWSPTYVGPVGYEKQNLSRDAYAQTELIAWCIDLKDRNVMVRIRQFPATCYIPLPKDVSGMPYLWSINSATKVFNAIRDRLNEFAPYSFILEMKEELYYYIGDNNQKPMIRLFFRNNAGVRKLMTLLRKPLWVKNLGYGHASPLLLQPLETNIDNLRKFMSERDMTYCQFFKAKNRRAPTGRSDLEFVMTFEEVEPIPLETSANWVTSPKILAADIECYAANHLGFPKSFLDSDLAYMISCTAQRFKRPETRKRYCIVVGQINVTRATEIFRKNAGIAGDAGNAGKDSTAGNASTSGNSGNGAGNAVNGDVEFICVTNELEMMREFGRIWDIERPNFMSGYNILSFDWHYLNMRLRKMGVEWPDLGFLPGTHMLPEKKWSSSAAGNVWLRMLDTPGCPHLDMLLVIRRDYPNFSKYDLGTTAPFFLDGKTKHDVKAKRMFEIYQRYQNAENGLALANATTDTSPLPPGYSKEKYLTVWKAEFELAKDELAEVAAYCVQDSELVVDIFDKINSWITHNQFANIFQVTPVTISTRGQQVRVISQIYAAAKKQNIVITTRQRDYQFAQGAFVGIPDPGFIKYIACIDFSSMYPTNIEEENISWDTFVPEEAWKCVPIEKCRVTKVVQEERKELELEDNEDENDEEGDAEEDSTEKRKRLRQKMKKNESIIRHYEYRWYQGRKGLLPIIVRNCINQRNIEKGVLKKLEKAGKKGSLEYIVTDIKQNGLKIAANSAYGSLGAQSGGRAPLVEGAMCTTYIGRVKITKVNETFKETYGARIVYNDTDSAFIQFPNITSTKQCFEMGMKAADVATGLFGGITKVELEKCGDCIFFKSKKYVMVTIDGKTFEYKFDDKEIIKRGLAIRRRDYNEWTREVYTELMHMCLRRRPIVDVIEVLKDRIKTTLMGEVDPHKLVLIKKYGGNYKKDSYPMEVFARYLISTGKAVQAGDRLDYFIVKNKGSTKRNEAMAARMRDAESYFDNLGKEGADELDVMYYVDHQMSKPIEQLIQVSYRQELFQIGHTFYQAPRKKVFLFNPIEIAVQLYLAGQSLDLLVELYRNPAPPIQLYLVLEEAPAQQQTLPKGVNGMGGVVNI